MWISRKAYEDLQAERTRALSNYHLLKEHNKALQVTLDWLRVRQTQVEMERAQLVSHYMGINVSVPSIVPERPNLPHVEGHPLNAVPNFDDMGDEEARRLGIGWADDGTLRYPTEQK